VPIVFWSFRVMVGLGVLMILTGLASLALRVRGRLFDVRIFSRWCVLMGPSGFVALLAGWFVTETGRQPFTVYGVLRTADSVSPIASAGVAFSLLAFVAVYLIVFGMGVWYLLRLMGADPEDAVSAPMPEETRAAGITPMQVAHGRAGEP
jgi:cytochrome d ubiquinol oxidase subunit I